VSRNEWATAEHADAYLARGAVYPPHRDEGEVVLLSCLPATVRRVVDLGCGDGRLLALVLAAHPGATGVAVDSSPTMLAAAGRRFDGHAAVEVRHHDLDEPLPADLGPCDAVVSSFAIHHCEHPRKRELYREVFELLAPGGVFANLEHVASPTEPLHARFFESIGFDAANEDPSNKLLDVESQLDWFRQLGFGDVDCLWKWRELALLAGTRPGR
jgi:tRNA (cmo5U34)-methyltransferase